MRIMRIVQSKRAAYWVSPSGEVMSLDLDSNEQHMDAIQRSPAKFGLTTEQINQVYRDFKEDPSNEGNARGHIFRELMKKGWIRVRWFNRFNAWTIQTWDLSSKKIREAIWDFVTDMMQGGKIGQHDAIRLMGLKDGEVMNTDSDRIMHGVILSHREPTLGILKRLLFSQKCRENYSVFVRNLRASDLRRKR